MLHCIDNLNFHQNICTENQYISLSNGILKHFLPVAKFSLSMSTVIPRPGCNTYVIHHWTLNPTLASTGASSAYVNRNPQFLPLQLVTYIQTGPYFLTSHFSYACKMRCPLNLVLEYWEYLWFYLTFWIVILDYGLKLHKLSIYTIVILKKGLEIH